ncbi:MAG: hypothetical protein IV093_16980 [Rubrivivax sp.]|nr:hypothetical protein [Rubrivivax sp.]
MITTMKLAQHQVRRLDAVAETEFTERLAELVRRTEPSLLPRFPIQVQRRIVSNLVERARAVGAASQRAMATWACLMAAIAPNIGADPAVRAWLARTGSTVDATIPMLSELLSPRDWERIDAARADLALFTPVSADVWPLEQRVAAALPLVLWDRVSVAEAPSLAAQAMQMARQLGMAALEDAPLALAALRKLYEFAPGAAQPAWLDDLRQPGTPPAVQLAMLRARIMLDHGRWA